MSAEASSSPSIERQVIKDQIALDVTDGCVRGAQIIALRASFLNAEVDLMAGEAIKFARSSYLKSRSKKRNEEDLPGLAGPHRGV